MWYVCFVANSNHTQIHYLENGSVEIYSRNAERNTGKFPDVVGEVSRLSCFFMVDLSSWDFAVVYERLRLHNNFDMHSTIESRCVFI